MSTVKRHWPLICGVGVYWATVMMLVISSIHMAQGHLVYPLDDAYIHMAVAKNVVAHHVWGVTRYEFTSSTSSPLWTLLLTVSYFVFGIRENAPLILNLIFGTLAICVSYLFLTKYIKSRARVFAVIVITVFATPLPTLTVIGMEHVLHALLSLSFVYLAISVLSTTENAIPKRNALLAALGALVTASRYEGMFLVFVVCLLFVVHGRARYALALGTAASLPVVIYGAWCMGHGWYFLPNSVLLKGHMPQFSLNGIANLMGFGALGAIQGNPHILMLLTCSLFLMLFHYFGGEEAWDDIRRANVIFIGCLLLHMQFAATGWLFRYEAYLVFMGIIVIAIALNDLLPETIAWRPSKEALPLYACSTLLFLVTAGSFAQRVFLSLAITPQAAKNIYEQQYQMGLFLNRFYQGKVIGLNDIGAVSYLADIRIVDLWGLGTLEPAKLKLQKRYTAQEIYDLTRQRGVAAAIVYDDWFKINGNSVLPQGWIQAGQWRISNNVSCGSETVSIYGVAAAESEELTQCLRRFEGELPVDVMQYVEYREGRR